MGKRDEQRKLKMSVLARIKADKGILFGAFSQHVTKIAKIERWKLIYNHAQSLGLVPPTKDWTYAGDSIKLFYFVRNIFWPSNNSI